MKIDAVVSTEDAKEIYDYLIAEAGHSKKERRILNSVDEKIKFIKRKFKYKNKPYGDSIAKNLIPKKYIKAYKISNLYRAELPHAHRMMYSIKTNEKKERILIIISILDHKSYDVIFGYYKK